MNERPVLPWMPVYVKDILGSDAYQHMRDYQQAWYWNLLVRSWDNKAKPGYLSNDCERLYQLANARTKWFFNKENAGVMACFLVSADERWIFNKKLLEVYEAQLVKYRERGGRPKKPKTSLSVSDLVILEIYKNYPRRTKKMYALDCIAKAIQVLAALESLTDEAAAERIFQSVRIYAKSSAGNQGEFTPHCSTWMNQKQYMDDPKDWEVIRGKERISPASERRTRNDDIILNALRRRHGGDGDPPNSQHDREGTDESGIRLLAGTTRKATAGSD